MDLATWQDFYRSDLQSLYAPLLMPALFLLYRVVAGRPSGGRLPQAGRFVDAYAIAFAVETIVDLIASVVLVRALGIEVGAGGTAVMLTFVLLGDFRVYLLVLGLIAVAHGRPWQSAVPAAAAWTLLVPVLAYATNAALRALLPAAHPSSIWLVYEVYFALVALTLRARLLPAAVPAQSTALRRYLAAVLLYVATYYALWATADVLIQIAHADLGWVLRCVPNQLYYAFWVPVVFALFFARR